MRARVPARSFSTTLRSYVRALSLSVRRGVIGRLSAMLTRCFTRRANCVI